MMKFIYQFDKQSPKVEMTVVSDSSLSEILDAFESFLKAATFEFDGELDFVNEEKGN